MILSYKDIICTFTYQFNDDFIVNKGMVLYYNACFTLIRSIKQAYMYQSKTIDLVILQTPLL